MNDTSRRPWLPHRNVPLSIDRLFPETKRNKFGRAALRRKPVANSIGDTPSGSAEQGRLGGMTGDSDRRRLLFDDALQGSRSALWAPYYLALQAGGMRTTVAFMALGRKLARVCFALLRSGTDCSPEVRKTACPQT